jgi:hypothetical protein
MICAAVNALEVYLVLLPPRVADRLLASPVTVLAGQLSLFELGANPVGTEPLRTRAPSPAKPAKPKGPRLDPPPSSEGEPVDPVTLLAGVLAKFGADVGRPGSAMVDLRQARDDWLRRLQAAHRSASALTAYRIAIDDLLDWNARNGRSVFEEATIVDYLAAYQRRASPAPATYYRRFGLLRRLSAVAQPT